MRIHGRRTFGRILVAMALAATSVTVGSRPAGAVEVGEVSDPDVDGGGERVWCLGKLPSTVSACSKRALASRCAERAAARLPA